MKIKILYYSGWFVTRLLTKLFFRIKVSGWEHVPKQGGFIFATNHKSNFDPPLVGSWIPRQVYFLAKKELFKNKFFGWVITRTNSLPLNRGAIDRKAIEMCVEVIKQGYGVTVFPEGTRSKTDEFLPPKPGIGLIAKQVDCPIVVAYLHGSNRFKDCFWGRTRLSLTFGPMISAEWVKSIKAEKDGYAQIAAEVMNRIAQIRAETMA